MAGGWDDFEATQAPDDAQAEALDKIFFDCFTTDAGKKVLAYWKQRFLDQPVCVPGAGAEVGFHREGQNSVAREAIGRVRRAMTPKGATNG